MKRLIAYLVVVGLLTACSGIPLRSMPRLMHLQQDLLNASPDEFMLAAQTDVRMVPPAGAVPVMHLNIQPSEPTAFDAVELKLPMRVNSASANSLGLTAPAADRRWLIYSFPPESQAELSRIQNFFKGLQARSDRKGGSISIGISQSGIASRDSVLAKTIWESWLQTSRKEGFFTLWTGTVEELLKRANAEAAAKRQETHRR